MKHTPSKNEATSTHLLNPFIKRRKNVSFVKAFFTLTEKVCNCLVPPRAIITNCTFSCSFKFYFIETNMWITRVLCLSTRENYDWRNQSLYITTLLSSFTVQQHTLKVRSNLPTILAFCTNVQCYPNHTTLLRSWLSGSCMSTDKQADYMWISEGLICKRWTDESVNRVTVSNDMLIHPQIIVPDTNADV